MVPYLVSAFTKPTLSNLVKECFGTDFPDIFHKPQIDYIYRYLKDLEAASVLLEFNYIDKDYLEDYSSYYVKCFSNNGHRCARLHFFSKEVTHTQFNALLQDCSTEAISNLNQSYLGYIVIKPLPKTFIGKTCLKSYPSFNLDNGNNRCLTKKYNVDLFGISLSVNSIAFQEQDNVVSACATTAIWSSLHALEWRNVRNIPACSIITTNAINHIEGSSNKFPNKELSNKQILRALDFEKLRHHEEKINSTDKKEFFDTVRYHINSKLPLIIGVDVYEVIGNCSTAETQKLNKLGSHAVTILGYKASEFLDEVIYIHDDRIGPFVRATLVKLQNYESNEKEPIHWGLALQNKSDHGCWENIHQILVPNFLVIPTPQKVRLSFTSARNTCDFILREFNDWLASLGKDGFKFVNSTKFEINLVEISKIRSSLIQYKFENTSDTPVLKAGEIDELNKQKIRFLTGSFARFQWMGSFTLKNMPAFKILFDATDIPQGDAVSSIFIENKYYADLILTIHKKYAQGAGTGIQPQNENFYSSFLKHLSVSVPPLLVYLDKSYGGLRAPQYLKADEFSGGQITGNSSMQRHYESNKHTASASNFLFCELIENDKDSHLIWAIADDGALLIGKEMEGIGHPCLTGFKAARIAGELHKTANERWGINCKSGRYSGDYRFEDTQIYLENVLNKFQDIFPLLKGKLTLI